MDRVLYFIERIVFIAILFYSPLIALAIFAIVAAFDLYIYLNSQNYLALKRLQQ